MHANHKYNQTRLDYLVLKSPIKSIPRIRFWSNSALNLPEMTCMSSHGWNITKTSHLNQTDDCPVTFKFLFRKVCFFPTVGSAASSGGGTRWPGVWPVHRPVCVQLVGPGETTWTGSRAAGDAAQTEQGAAWIGTSASLPAVLHWGLPLLPAHLASLPSHCKDVVIYLLVSHRCGRRLKNRLHRLEIKTNK